VHKGGSLAPTWCCRSLEWRCVVSITASPWFDRVPGRVIDRGLRRYTRRDVRDYASLLRFLGAYRVVEIVVSR